MAVNADREEQWPDDIEASVARYNEWYMDFAPRVYESVREQVELDVRNALDATEHFRKVTGPIIRNNPGIVGVLRMATSPPLAVDRLRGLASMDITKNTVDKMENGRMPPRMKEAEERETAEAIAEIVTRMLDRDLFVWLEDDSAPSEPAINRATAVVAERFADSKVKPIVRNAQEERQFEVIEGWLETHGYERRRPPSESELREMEAGTFAFHLNVEGGPEGDTKIPTDVAIQPHEPRSSRLPILVEAKSAGDFTNVNKRRKEEATKARQLRQRYGDDVEYVLFLGGYFDERYLSYEAEHGIDWVWEHRVEDFAEFGL